MAGSSKDYERVLDELWKNDELRTLIYINKPEIRNTYRAWTPGIKDLIRTNRVDNKITAGLKAIFSLEATHNQGEDTSTVTDVDDFVRAMAIEYYAQSSGKLVDLTGDGYYNTDQFLRYIGNSRLVIPSRHADADWDLNHLFTYEKEVVKNECKDQEWYFKKVDSRHEAFVWVSLPDRQGTLSPGQGRKQIFASIGSSRWITWEKAGSYITHHSFGILGKYEKENQGIVFIDPLVIWHPHK